MNEMLRQYVAKLEDLAGHSGLDYYNVDFEEVPDTFMTEIAVYGFPVRMPHWSFGLRYIYQLVQHRMGHSRLFEVVFPGNPNRAYLANRNTIEENTLVSAHVLGHADFAKNNLLFKRSQEQVGSRIVEQAAAHARRIAEAVDKYGAATVEAVMDAALALEQHIDITKNLTRPLYPEYEPDEPAVVPDAFRERFNRLEEETPVSTDPPHRRRSKIPPAPESDLLWFIARYAPELDDWERDIFLAVREESFYFYPVFACQIMNEGWACYWHARLLREADFLPQQVYLDAIKAHSDVVRPFAGEDQVAFALNPYHVGFEMWEYIIDSSGLDTARKIMKEDDDFSFIRNYLDEDLAAKLGMFEFMAKKNGEISVTEDGIDAIRERILAPKFNFGAPTIFATSIEVDGTLQLTHDYQRDDRGLDLMRAEKVLEYIERGWRRPVRINTIDAEGNEKVVTIGSAKEAGVTA
ncbi:MAG: SpoVR family protein [Proteobacteria bacterium]|nr:SpoVR family protein [Pseudomonadota bacterium]